jgi:hypothetical protein
LCACFILILFFHKNFLVFFSKSNCFLKKCILFLPFSHPSLLFSLFPFFKPWSSVYIICAFPGFGLFFACLLTPYH